MRRLEMLVLSVLMILQFMSCGDENTPENVDEGDDPIGVLSEKISEEKENPELYFKRAEIYYEGGAYEFAERDLLKAIGLNGREYKYHHLLADVLLDQNNSRAALDRMKIAVEQFPENEQTTLKYAELQLILRQYLQGISALDQYLNNHPGCAECFFLKGAIYLDMGDRVNASKNFRRCTEIDAEHVDAWIAIGDLLMQEGNPLAIKMFENAQRVDPQNVNAALGVPLFFHRKGQINRAKEEYRVLSEKFPSRYQSYYNLGLIHLETDSLNEAYRAFDTAVKMGPTIPNTYYYKGFAAQLLGNLEEAKTLYEQTIALEENHENAVEALADVNKLIEQE